MTWGHNFARSRLSKELWEKAQSARVRGEEREAKRLRVLELHAQGLGAKAIAKRVGDITADWVRFVVDGAKKRGAR